MQLKAACSAGGSRINKGFVFQQFNPIFPIPGMPHVCPSSSLEFLRPLKNAALVLAGSMLALSALAATAPTAAQLQAAKQEGAQIGYSLQGSPAVDANGNVQTTASGAIATGGGAGQAVLMQQLTGVGTFVGSGNPGGDGQVFGGSGSISAYVDIPCSAPVGTIRSAAGIQLRFEGCEQQGGQIRAVVLQVCGNVNSGGLCAPTDFSSASSLPAGRYTALGNASYGVGCNNQTETCRVTVNQNYTISSQASQLKQTAATQPTGTLQSSLQSVVNSPLYQQQLNTQQPLVNCYAANQQSFLKTGVVSTCSGNTTTYVTGGPAGNTCNPSKTCLATTTSTKNYTRTCTQSFPVTTYKCELTTPSKTCTITRNLGIPTSSCSAADIAGGILVGSTPQKCTRVRLSFSGIFSGCIQTKQTETYVFPSKTTRSNCVASPLPLAGPFSSSICALNQTNAELTCNSGGWVGRTLSDQQCQTSTVGPNGTVAFSELDYRAKAGCGYCANQTIGYTCQGGSTSSQPSDTCATSNLAGCTLVSITPQSQEFGLTLSQQLTYSCSLSTTGCSQWQVSNGCTTADASYGVSSMPVTVPGDGGAFNQVIATGSVAEGVAQSVSSDSSNVGKDPPTIFNGQDMRCRKPLGFLTGLVSNDCCQTNLMHPGGGKPLTSCSQEEVDLAAARRASFDVYIGSYCSKKTNYLFFSRCDEQTQTYCVFQGILPRLVQVQGREQLQALAASSFGSVMQNATLSFPYYSGAGGWTTPITVNGVEIAAYEQPGYCSSASATAAALEANPNAASCPSSLGVSLAACEKGSACGALPSVPEAGSETWTISTIDPLKLTSTALSYHSIAKGGCDTTTERCAYQISAWPSGSAGRAMVSRDVSFPLYTSPEYSGGTTMASIGPYSFRASPLPAPPSESLLGAVPATIPAQYSTDSGATWHSFTVPSNIAGDVTIPGSDVTLTGGCTTGSATCDYRLTGSIAITAKPWGSATSPDCSGFTIDQFTALDMGKMDLSEWVADVESKVNANTTNLAAAAQQQISQGNSNSAPSPAAGLTATVSPVQAMGPFVAQLSISGNWPQTQANALQNTDPIYSVGIDWGDCSAPDSAMQLPAGGFSAQHLYESPDSPGICDSSGPAGPADPRTLKHTITLTIDSQSGVHKVTLSVVNVYENMLDTQGVSGTQTGAGGVSLTGTGGR